MSTLVKNSSLYLASTIMLKATSFLLLPLYSGLIPPEAYGKVYLVSSYVTFFTIFMTLSMPGSIHRFFFDCKNDDEVKELYSTIVIFVFIVSSFISIFLIAFNSVISGWMNVPILYLYIATGTVFFSAFYNLILALLYAKQEAKKISIVSIVCGMLGVVAQLVFVFTLKDKAFALILAMFVTGVMHMLIFLWFSRKYFTLRFNSKKIKLYLVYGLSQLPSAISSFVVSLADRFILNKYKNSAVVGIYGMGNTLGSIPTVLFSSMNSALSPIVFTDYSNKKLGNVIDISYSSQLIEKVTIILTIIITMLIVFSNNIVSILSEKYQQSSLVMYMVLFAVMIDLYRKLFMYPITYEVKYVKVKSAIWVFASILSIGLNLWLIPVYSYYGACISLISTNILTFLMILFASHKAMHPKYKFGKLIAIFALSLICSLAYFLGFSWTLFPVKLLLVMIYFFIIYKIYPIEYKTLFIFFKTRKNNKK
jgi:O-antigen/teichoic acid export membrane protein